VDRQTNRADHEGHDFGFVNVVTFVVPTFARTRRRLRRRRLDPQDPEIAVVSEYTARV
jgi:hypothetical protein